MYVVITGGSRGIGKALAYKFASCGYDLILTCEKNNDLLIDIKKDIESKYTKRKVFIKMGLLEKNDLLNFEKESNEKIIDNIYILINNAGKCDYNLLTQVSYERYKEITYANLDYMFLTTRMLNEILVKSKRGIIINITSMWGILGSSCESIYAMTKGAIIAFTKSMAKELKDSGIDVIAFALGAVDTDMCKNISTLYKNKEDLDKGIAEFVKTLDGGRMFTTSEIADKIFTYVSSKNYKSGDIIEINNGLK